MKHKFALIFIFPYICYGFRLEKDTSKDRIHSPIKFETETENKSLQKNHEKRNEILDKELKIKNFGSKATKQNFLKTFKFNSNHRTRTKDLRNLQKKAGKHKFIFFYKTY